jgi:hypothetical protein
VLRDLLPPLVLIDNASLNGLEDTLLQMSHSSCRVTLLLADMTQEYQQQTFESGNLQDVCTLLCLYDEATRLVQLRRNQMLAASVHQLMESCVSQWLYNRLVGTLDTRFYYMQRYRALGSGSFELFVSHTGVT